jgi:hypothetical protein
MLIQAISPPVSEYWLLRWVLSSSTSSRVSDFLTTSHGHEPEQSRIHVSVRFFILSAMGLEAQHP